MLNEHLKIPLVFVLLFEVALCFYKPSRDRNKKELSNQSKKTSLLSKDYKNSVSVIKNELELFSVIISNDVIDGKFEQTVPISDIFKNEFDLIEVGFATINGNVYTSKGKVEEFNALDSNSEWFSAIVSGSCEFYQSDVYPSPFCEVLSLTVSSPVANNGQVLGVVFFNLIGSS
ncbi:TPA: PDC sensor domain-containing protein [Vibrio vulnificus]